MDLMTAGHPQPKSEVPEQEKIICDSNKWNKADYHNIPNDIPRRIY